ncbi:hypothetical protein M8C21_018364, partial [Ambrosia artemisiifolia]
RVISDRKKDDLDDGGVATASQQAAEVNFLGKFSHPNLVKLLGYCQENMELLIVYEFMQRGSLNNHLFSKHVEALPWSTRIKIAIGAAQGLAFLHTSENNGCEILKYFVRRGHLYVKSDVYSFGVVMLEIITGLQVADPKRHGEKHNLVEWAKPLLINKKRINRVMDPRMEKNYPSKAAHKAGELIFTCLESLPENRPCMEEIKLQEEDNGEQSNSAPSPFLDKRIMHHEDSGEQINSASLSSLDEMLMHQEDNGELINSASSSSLDKMIMHKEDNGAQINSASSSSLDKRIMHQEDNGEHKNSASSSSLDKRSMEDHGERKDPSLSSSSLYTQCRVFSLAEIKLATNDFDDAFVIGKGGFGKVYKGKIDFGASTDVAIKRLECNSSQGAKEFYAEIKMLSNIRHSHIVVPPSGDATPLIFKVFTYSDLQKATCNFHQDCILGEGGFGKVFKGWLDSVTYTPQKVGCGLPVAIKKLNSESMQGFSEWQAEVTFLGKLKHPNVVELLGYCMENMELLLVYEFMQRGSLEVHLFRKGVEALSWSTRIKIAIGAAQGIAFLHSTGKNVIHRDMKASNILLDEDYNAKVSDFGLAKLGPSPSVSHVTTRVMGSYGYAAPEYVATGHLYVKSDVYSFGVVMLEIITGLRAIDTGREAAKVFLKDWCGPFLNKKRIHEIMDPRLKKNYPAKAAHKAAELILSCLRPEPKTRPSMEEVV